MMSDAAVTIITVQIQMAEQLAMSCCSVQALATGQTEQRVPIMSRTEQHVSVTSRTEQHVSVTEKTRQRNIAGRTAPLMAVRREGQMNQTYL
jgi:hypothetical protein